MKRIKTCLGALVALAVLCVPAQADRDNKFRSPDILVLGDSQMAFGAGEAFLNFFKSIRSRCEPNATQAMYLDKLGKGAVGVVGVRSTSLRSWVARDGKRKDKICKLDRKWRKNAASFGVLNSTRNKYVQIGEGPEYQFCEPGKSAFEAMFARGYYQPKLVVLSFLGNSAHSWAHNKKSALEDVEHTMQQLPDGMPCVFMTTAPTYKKKTVRLRRKAQENVRRAFMKNMSRCSFVAGYTDATVAANQGNKKHFRRASRVGSRTRFTPTARRRSCFWQPKDREFARPCSNSWQMLNRRNCWLRPGHNNAFTLNCDLGCLAAGLILQMKIFTLAQNIQ